MLKFTDVTKRFPTPNGPRDVLGGVSFEVTAGTITTIFGPNGCGKTTLMNILSGLDAPSSGSITFSLAGGKMEELRPAGLRHSLGFVFQDYRRTLLPWATVGENIRFPLRMRGVTPARQHQRLTELLQATGVSLDLTQRVRGLSGGQAQMVCLLRALIIEPALLILDEPFSALDYERTLLLREKLLEIVDRLRLTVLCISHDIEDALYLGDRVLFFTKAPTVVADTVEVPFSRPRTPELTATPEFAHLKSRALALFRECAGATEL